MQKVEDFSTIVAMQATTTPLDLAIQKAGGNAALARMLKVHRSAVTHWRRIGIPAAQAVRVSALTGIPIADLRPDLAHAPKDAPPPHSVSPNDHVTPNPSEVGA